jgi:hypothetical protein
MLPPAPAAFFLRNVYGWFQRSERGVYRLTPLGEAAVHRWASSPEPHAGAAERELTVA